nr:glycosyltransferase family 2 protein [uncultured Flavobacterium sp.]
MISVCVATYNGVKFIKKQISSILDQLGENDEIIISDDGSTDGTLSIINSFDDNRIVLLNHKKNEEGRKKKYPHYLISANFENALKEAKGDFIFLADQDDIWHKNKVEIMLSYLKYNMLVISDYEVIDENDMVTDKPFFNRSHSSDSFIKNIITPSYHGCLIAFRKEVLKIALPFPEKLILHDTWIGILASTIGNVVFINDRLVKYRRHELNSSFTVGASKNDFFFKVFYRIDFFFKLLKRIVMTNFKLLINE